ncbi:MAG: cytochrome P450 [Hyphomicrobium sp.]
MKPSPDPLPAPFLDLADPNFSVRSPAVREAREKSWYARTPYGLAVLRYAEVGSLLRDARLRQGSYKWPAHNRASGVFAEWWLRMLLNRVGSDHDRLRRLVNPAFSPRLVTPLLPRFEAIACELIDAFAANGRCEFMSEFAEPYSTRVICELLGLSNEHWRALADASAGMGLALGVTYSEHQESVNAATEHMLAYARQLVEDRRTSPRDDFVSTLIKANENKETLDDDELHDMIVLAIFGGIDTTRNQLGLGMSVFIDHPEQWELLASRPELARNAVEEIMRVRPTTTWVTREALEDITVNELVIAKGTTVHLFAEAAGTDPCAFAPGVDILAEQKRHYGFGAGTHYCLGQTIARADLTEAFRQLSRRLANPRYDGEPVWLPDSGNTGAIRLPITFEVR